MPSVFASTRSRRRLPWPCAAAGSLAATLACSIGAHGADVPEAAALFNAGKYAECAEMAAAEIDQGDLREDWRRLKIEAELAEGKYDAALTSAEEALGAFPASVELRLLAHSAYLYNGQIARAATELDMIERFVLSDPRRYSTSESRVALGRFFLKRGMDARQALEVFYDPVVARRPDYVEAYLATAELALDKYDNALAVKTLSGAPEEAKASPQYHYLLARAYREDDSVASTKALEAALRINPRHVPSLLLAVDALVDAEKYSEAREALDEVLAINSRHPLAWAYRAALAHLEGDADGEAEARAKALADWPTNPEVDHTIGRELSEKYRFAEGASYQRRALQIEPAYLPARMQLAQDLLRLGEEDEGWRLADEVAEADGYNVVAHNLVTLRDSLQSYRVLVSDGFRVRMESREAAIYGPAVLDVLRRARQTLAPKYEVQLPEVISVEIFPRQKDFAVRTFGLPGADGYLGVCFGNVITANSPAALRDSLANWQSVLWHEFCHVVTLHKTRNKMPRWLSEGISVYEERQENPAWGQAMTPEYRRRILSGDLTPLSQLSADFLSPESPMDVQFAYFESSLAVEFLVREYGLATLKALLDELGAGMAMDDALVHHVAPLSRLDAAFARFAREQAEALAPALSWENLEIPPDADSAVLGELLADNPSNFATNVRIGQALVREEKWREAIEHAQRLREQYPTYVGPGNPYHVLSLAYRELGDVAGEREALEAWAERDAEAIEAYQRLIELGEQAGDWQAVELNAQRMLSVNPLTPTPHRWLARAAEKSGNIDAAIAAYRALLEFESTDSVDAHYQLALLLQKQGDHHGARRAVLKALEEAPRFLAGHRLLLELVSSQAEAGEGAQQSNPAETDVQESSKAAGL